MKQLSHSKIRIVLVAVALGAFTGCVGFVDEPRHGGVYVEPRGVVVGAGVAVRDDYVYYPGYEVYYSSSRRQYVYLDGRSWVSRPAPPHVSVDVLFASPSVRLDFHDSPSFHHSAVVRQYPRHWAPSGSRYNRGDERRYEGQGNERGRGR